MNKSEYINALSVLADMLTQHASDNAGRIAGWGISANDDAIALMRKIGWLSYAHPFKARFKWTAAALKARRAAAK